MIHQQINEPLFNISLNACQLSMRSPATLDIVTCHRAACHRATDRPCTERPKPPGYESRHSASDPDSSVRRPEFMLLASFVAGTDRGSERYKLVRRGGMATKGNIVGLLAKTNLIHHSIIAIVAIDQVQLFTA